MSSGRGQNVPVRSEPLTGPGPARSRWQRSDRANPPPAGPQADVAGEARSGASTHDICKKRAAQRMAGRRGGRIRQRSGRGASRCLADVRAPDITMEAVDMSERDPAPRGEHPYSDLPYDSSAHPRRRRRLPEAALGVLCAEAQADGVPCFELGRDCETCERAYRSWADVPAADE